MLEINSYRKKFAKDFLIYKGRNNYAIKKNYSISDKADSQILHSCFSDVWAHSCLKTNFDGSGYLQGMALCRSKRCNFSSTTETFQGCSDREIQIEYI